MCIQTAAVAPATCYFWHFQIAYKNVGNVSPVIDAHRGNQEEWGKRIETVLIGYLHALRRDLVISNKLSKE